MYLTKYHLGVIKGNSSEREREREREREKPINTFMITQVDVSDEVSFGCHQRKFFRERERERERGERDRETEREKPINTLLFKLMYLTKYHLGVIKGNSSEREREREREKPINTFMITQVDVSDEVSFGCHQRKFFRERERETDRQTNKQRERERERERCHQFVV